MKIEILYPEVCNLYGDSANILYLKQNLPEAEFIETGLNDEPLFIKEKPSLIYMGSMTEKTQEKVIEKLKPYKQRIEFLIEDNIPFLFTGNSMEVLGKYILNEDESKIDGVGVLELFSKRDMFHRYNGLVLGEFNDIPIVGFKSQFTEIYSNNSVLYFMKVVKGIGINKQTNLEGIKIKNFIGTQILGPILVLNPLFTKYIFKTMGIEDKELYYEKEAIKAYEKRLKEFKDEKIKF